MPCIFNIRMLSVRLVFGGVLLLGSGIVGWPSVWRLGTFGALPGELGSGFVGWPLVWCVAIGRGVVGKVCT